MWMFFIHPDIHSVGNHELDRLELSSGFSELIIDVEVIFRAQLKVTTRWEVPGPRASPQNRA